MNLQEYTKTENLIKYSFLWSEARLLIAALALFLGGIPPITLIFYPYGLVGTLLNLSWIISGVSVVYLAYKWNKGKMLFGSKDKKDMYAFAVMVISGLNLGLVGITGSNIGMSISRNTVVFWLVGLLYIWAAYRLYKRWMSHGKKIF